MSKVLVISDTQAPAQHPNTIEFLKYCKKKYNPDTVVHIGDELDLHNLSKYIHDPDLPGAKDELELGLEFMYELYRLFPEAKVCISNHGARPYLRAKEIGLPSQFIKPYREWMRAPRGWIWDHQFIIDGVAYIHGEGLSGDGARLKACTQLQRSVVFGHLHSHAGISYFSTKEALLFGFNVGCLIDLHSPYFEYNRHQMHRPIIGIGLVEDGIPRFIPMELDKFGLWVKRKDKTVKTVPLPDPDDVKCPHCSSHRVIRRGRCRPGTTSELERKRKATGKVYGQRFSCYNCLKWFTVK